MIKMKTFATPALLIAVGLTVTYQPCTAQNGGTPEETLRQAVSALAADDQAAIAKLSSDQVEFKKFVCPTMQARMSNTTAAQYYTTHQKVSQVGVDEAKAALAGKKWEVVKVIIESAQRNGKDFQLFGSPAITVRDEGGQEKTVRLVGGLLDRGGVYKITTYYVSPSLKASK